MASTLGTITTAAYLAADPWSNINAENPSKSVARFKVLHNPFGKDQAGNQLPAVAVNYVCFGSQAKIVADYLKKGSCPTVIGAIKSISVAKDKDGKEIKTQSGETIINLECQVMQDGLFLGAKGSASTESAMADTTGDLAGAPF